MVFHNIGQAISGSTVIVLIVLIVFIVLIEAVLLY